ncbi:hypothetical protein [Clostridium lacusfryxellense]|uniref:hypothetical protein n=1 Tax=Clostridium lacusfryxellense TaxID=205328 RepID=UPI001C0C0D8A|nr:hypothetical protein [Clostridium lacusfryxellense]MBU3113066.1 hypothetical protein [Clostridium lacusfryxellense]
MKKSVIIVSFLVMLVLVSTCLSKSAKDIKSKEKVTITAANVAIDKKLDTICDNPKVAASSNPYDYTKDSQDYKDIVSSGDDALKYMLTKFDKSKENGLREYVMAIACSEMLKENIETKKWETGREWYENYIIANK